MIQKIKQLLGGCDHTWKHFRITQLFDEDRGGPPNTEIIDRKCLKCNEVKTEYRFT